MTNVATIVVATSRDSSGFMPSPSFFFTETKSFLFTHAQVSSSFLFRESDLTESLTKFSGFTNISSRSNTCGDFFVDNNFRSDFLGDGFSSDDRFNEFD